jgi:TonB family protein
MATVDDSSDDELLAASGLGSKRRASFVRTSGRFRGALLLSSLALHGALVVALQRHIPPRPMDESTAIELVLSAVEDPSAAAGGVGDVRPGQEKNREGETPRPAGGASEAFVDGARRGRAGDQTGEKAIHLADRAETKTFVPDPTNRLDRDQHQRLKSGESRASWEDRRATPHPLDATFVAVGTGRVAERRDAARDPSRGSLHDARSAEASGGALGAGSEEAVAALEPSAGDGVRPPNAGHLLDDAAPSSAVRRGTDGAAPGLGIAVGAVGADHRASANSENARPDVAEGYAAVPAANPGKASDNVDSAQEAEKLMKSLVQSSTFGSRQDGSGRGGEVGAGDLGANGTTGDGSKAGPAGDGFGDVLDWNSRDGRLVGWYRRLHGKIDPLWKDAFPKEDLLELRQGTVILEFSVHRDGSITVAWPPVRRSGIDAFDKNVAAALRRASPVEPPPAVLGRDTVRIRAPFRVDNPLIK